MWQRFTKRARRVVFFAQEEAGKRGKNFVAPEHLLLGIIREEDTVAARILTMQNVSLESLREKIQAGMTQGEGRMEQDMQLTAEAKQALDFAYDEAHQINNAWIGTEHILLGLIRQGESEAGRRLAEFGAELEATRKILLELQDNDSGEQKPKRTGLLLGELETGASESEKEGKRIMWQRFTERARRVVFFAQEEAGNLGQNFVSTEHILLGLIRENDCVAARVLIMQNVSLDDTRAEVLKQATHGDGRLGQDMQLTPRAKKVIDLAYDEARQLSNNYIGTEHILLGLIREGEGLAGRVLAKLGVELEQTRREIQHLQDNAIGRAPKSDGASGGQASEIPQTERIALASELLAFARRVLDGATTQPEAQPEPAPTALADIAKGMETQAEQIAELAKMLGDVILETGAKSDSEEAELLRQYIAQAHPLWAKKSLVSLMDVSEEQFLAILDVAAGLKALDLARKPGIEWQYTRTLAMIFEKPSLRTRVSFEASMAHLRGHAINLAPGEVGIGTREPVEDVAGVLSRWVDVIAARVFKHETVAGLAQHGTIPVINALSDREHPIQALADLLTLREKVGPLGNEMKLAYVGDGNNVLHALLLACALTGVNISAACPEAFQPLPEYVAKAKEYAEKSGATVTTGTDAAEAVKDADAVYTDVWTSMGQEEERELRLQIFAPYQINAELLAGAKPNALVLHCLPAHRGEEISADVMTAHAATIYEQAENRLHTQKALLMLIIGL